MINFLKRKVKKEEFILDPNNPATIFFQEGLTALNAKNYPKAINSFKKYLTINPFDEKVQNYLKKAETENLEEEKTKKDNEKYEYVLKDTRIITSMKKKTTLSIEEAKNILITHIENFISQGFVTKEEAQDFLDVNLDLIEKGYCQFFTDINGTIIIYVKSSEFILINPSKEEYFEKKWDISNFDKWGLRKR